MYSLALCVAVTGVYRHGYSINVARLALHVTDAAQLFASLCVYWHS